jgi:hypothetical protein
MSSHLLLKWLHLPAARGALRRAIDGFLDGYGHGPGTAEPAHLGRVVGCLLIARVIGSSPAEYLTAAERPVVLGAGRSLLDRPCAPAEWTGRLG